MSEVKEARVPDIGDFDDVPVIEVLIKAGDTVEKDQGLVTLESDKATMEVPAPFAGTVKEVKVKEGDSVSEGVLLAMIEVSGGNGGQEGDKQDGNKDKDKAGTDQERKQKSPDDEGRKKQASESSGGNGGKSSKKSSGGGGVKEARVPDIGDFEDVPVIEVLVKAGDSVEKDQGLVTLESDKATMEVPAPFAGTVKEVKVKEGDSVSEGVLIATIEVAGEGDAEEEGGDTDQGAEEKASKEKQSEEKQFSSGQSESGTKKQEQDTSGGERDRKPAEPDEIGPRTPPVSFDASVVMPENAPYASPAVRAFARELGVDISQVKGSGRKGRIQREDVQSYVKQALATGAKPTTGGGGGGRELLAWPKVDFSKFGETEEQPLSRIKKISGANLSRNWAVIPHVTQHDEADITELEAFRKQLGQENKDLKITPLVFQIKAVVAALKEFPHFNASLDAAGETLTLKKYFHIGIAVDTPDGLVVPVIRDADKKGLLELASELAELSKKARDKKLTSAEMSGGCFSISSLGGIGGTAFTPIINAPEVAILGVTRAKMKPVWNGDEFEPRLMLPLSLSYDHRVVDGADAARFTVYLARMLGDVRRLLL